MHTVSFRPETPKSTENAQPEKVSLLFRALTRELIPAAVFLDARVSSRPETPKSTENAQPEKS